MRLIPARNEKEKNERNGMKKHFELLKQEVKVNLIFFWFKKFFFGVLLIKSLYKY